MRYRVIKYKKMKKRKCPFETYEPEKRIEIRKEHALPFLIRMSNLGGLVGFWISSSLIVIKSFFTTQEKIKQTARKFILNNRTVEIRIKKK